jgi:hypothetical protein
LLEDLQQLQPSSAALAITTTLGAISLLVTLHGWLVKHTSTQLPTMQCLAGPENTSALSSAVLSCSQPICTLLTLYNSQFHCLTLQLLMHWEALRTLCQQSFLYKGLSFAPCLRTDSMS